MAHSRHVLKVIGFTPILQVVNYNFANLSLYIYIYTRKTVLLYAFLRQCLRKSPPPSRTAYAASKALRVLYELTFKAKPQTCSYE